MTTPQQALAAIQALDWVSQNGQITGPVMEGLLETGADLAITGGVFSVWQYMSAAQQASVLAGTGVDCTDAALAAITAINTMCPIGATLVFPAGKIVVQGNLPISVSTKVVGQGMPDYDGLSGGTRIISTSATNPCFRVTAASATFRDLGVINLSSSPGIDCAAILVDNNSDYAQRVDYYNVMTVGFYNGFDIRVGESWKMIGCEGADFHNYGVSVQNHINADAGDWTINACNFYGFNAALAGIAVLTSGGGKILAVKIEANNGFIDNGILINLTGTQELQIIGANIENTTGAPIKIIQSVPFVTIWGCFLSAAHYAGGPAIEAANFGYGSIGGNNLVGSGSGAAITFNNVNHVTVGPDQLNNFGSYVSQVGGSNVSIIQPQQPSALNVFDSLQTSGSYALSNGGLTVTNAGNAIESGARVVNLTTFGLRIAEFTVSSLGSGGAGSIGVGILDGVPSLLNTSLGDPGGHSIGYYGDGGVYQNNVAISLSPAMPTFTAGDIIGVVYRPELRKLWLRKNNGGWLNDVIGNQNPDLGLGGIPFGVLGVPVYFGATMQAHNGAVTMNAGQSAYSQTPPNIAMNS